MQTGIVDNLTPEPVELRLPARRTERFEQTLAARQALGPDAAPLDPAGHRQLRQASEQFVASAFVLPLLAQMRQDPFRSDLFHGGSAEDAFQSQLDTILADRITHRANFPLVDVIVNRVLSSYGTTARAAAPSTPTPARIDRHG